MKQVLTLAVAGVSLAVSAAYVTPWYANPTNTARVCLNAASPVPVDTALSADGTKLDRNPDGKRQEGKEKYARLVTLQRVTGIRRAELGKLVGSDLVHKGDSWYVRVRRGKGGKSQI